MINTIIVNKGNRTVKLSTALPPKYLPKKGGVQEGCKNMM